MRASRGREVKEEGKGVRKGKRSDGKREGKGTKREREKGRAFPCLGAYCNYHGYACYNARREGSSHR